MHADYTKRLTVLSYAAYETATKVGLSPQEAVALLNKVEIRKFKDILCAFASEEDIRDMLVNGLCGNDAARSRASMDKKVRGWLSGKYQPTKREDLLELCFVLRLNTEKADVFLTMAGDEGLHWREPREIVYAFALDHGLDYREANFLLARVMPESKGADENAQADSFTPLVRQEVMQCSTEEELKQYLRSASGKLGGLHNSAYQQFMAMMQMLEKPASYSGSEERRYTTREVVEKYLDQKLPSVQDGKNLEEKKRSVLTDWPDETVLSRMKNRKTDVTRKVLILLFLATDGGDMPAEDWQNEDWYDNEWESQEDNADAAFRSSCMRINRMLADCGYGMLDPRNAFDWITLYCMRVEDESVSMDGLNERLSHVLEVLFEAAASET